MSDESKILRLSTEEVNIEKGWVYNTNSWWRWPEIAAQPLYYGVNIISTNKNGAKLNSSFKIDKQDNYKLFICYFKNQKGDFSYDIYIY